MRGTGRRALFAVAVGAALIGAVAACTTTITGTAAPATSTVPSRSTSTTAAPTSSTGTAPANAATTCAHLPKQAVTQAFGVTDVQVTTDSGSTLAGGISQVKCVVEADNTLRVNVVIQVYPASLALDAPHYFSTMKQKYPTARTLTNISGADAAGVFQQTVDGTVVDTAFAARRDSGNGSLDVLLVGIADSPGINDKLITFLNGLVND